MRTALAILTLLPACAEYGLHGSRDDGELLVPVIEVTPSSLAFPGLRPGQETSMPLTVANRGDALLRVEDVRFEGSGAYHLAEAVVPLDLPPGEERELDVVFSPINLDNYGRAVVVSTDPETPEVPVSLVGSGLLPRLVVAPSSYDFGLLGIGCEDSLELQLVNEGNADLTVSDVLQTGADFSALVPRLPLLIEPGHSAGIPVHFAPRVEGEVEGRLWVASDDPAGDDVAWLGGTGAWPGTVTERFEQDEPWERTDVLLYLDRSGSMGDDAINVGRNFDRFVEVLDDWDADWQLMVATDDDGCHNEEILTPDTDDAGRTFRVALAGPEGIATESGLTIAKRALEQSRTGGCNEGFLRSDARTSVILVSDEPEQSLAPWTVLVGQITDLAPHAVISAIAGPVPEGCETAAPGTGYYEAAMATGGTFMSICEADWGERLEALAAISVGLQTVFPLSQEPVEGTVEVAVDGAPAAGWTWVPSLRAVVFEEPPPAGSLVEITYDWYEDCW